ncbi:MAG: cryptochrome/photolyase family protein [Gemmatimonadales bacterium]|nr:cryptochrome/photolyase family protein [Gemmatimonadales bacterium]
MRPTYLIGPWELSTATAILPPTPRDGRVLFVDSTSKGSALPWHRHKLVLVLAALRHFRDELRAAGFEVDHRAAASYADGIREHCAGHAGDVSEVLVQAPAEWGIARSIAALADAHGGPAALPPVRLLPDRRFLTPRADFARWADGRKLFRMEDFYRWQRKRLAILLDADGQPAGGRWNLDAENRKTARQLRTHGLPPAPLAFPPDAVTRKVMALVDGMPGKWGTTAGFDLPVTRADALRALDDFLAARFAAFGPFEDAMLRGELVLYHSRLSAAMNVGLLHPREVVERALAVPGVPLPSLEGFVRQVIGWREYVNGIYWLRMPAYRDENYFGFARPLPQAYWDPDATDLACLADSVRMVRDHAFAHHIHRLMVLANFATLAGVHPLRLSEWFWAGFSDAFEWVELPNVVGMATFGDGGVLASKPYVSGAAYIDRMSDYCAGCRYDPKQRTGPDACPFNYLYWTFLDDIRRRKLDVGQRMAIPLKGLDRFAPATLAAMHDERRRFLDALAPDATGWRFHHDQG